MIVVLRSLFLAIFVLASMTFSTSEEYGFYKPYGGFVPIQDLPLDFQAHVRSISFIRHDAFDGSVAHSSLERKLFAWGNSLHIKTHESTLRRRSPIEAGQTVDKRILTEMEKSLRLEDFLSDVIMEVKTLSDTLCDIRITTFDQWTTIPGASFQVQGLKPNDILSGKFSRILDNEFIWSAGISESNLFGEGIKLGGAYRHDLERNSREAFFQNTNMTPLHLKLTTTAAARSDGDSLILKIEMPLRTSLDSYGFSLSLLALESSERLYFDANRLQELSSLLRVRKMGKAQVLRQFDHVSTQEIQFKAIRSFGYDFKFDIGPSFDYRDHYGSGQLGEVDSALLRDIAPLPSSMEGPELSTDAALGLAFSLYQFTYHTTKNHHNLKWNESVPHGWQLDTKVAMNQTVLSARNSDFLLEQSAKFQLDWEQRLFMHSQLSGKGFLSDSGEWRDAIAEAWLEAQWKQNSVTTTVLSGSMSALFATPLSRQLTLGEAQGLHGFPTFYFSGQSRYWISAEQRLFPIFEFLTAVPAFVLHATAGNTFPSFRDMQFDGLHYSVGAGIRLGKSKSVSKGIQNLDIDWPIGDSKFQHPVISIVAKKTL